MAPGAINKDDESAVLNKKKKIIRKASFLSFLSLSLCTCICICKSIIFICKPGSANYETSG